MVVVVVDFFNLIGDLLLWIVWEVRMRGERERKENGISRRGLEELG